MGNNIMTVIGLARFGHGQYKKDTVRNDGRTLNKNELIDS